MIDVIRSAADAADAAALIQELGDRARVVEAGDAAELQASLRDCADQAIVVIGRGLLRASGLEAVGAVVKPTPDGVALLWDAEGHALAGPGELYWDADSAADLGLELLGLAPPPLSEDQRADLLRRFGAALPDGFTEPRWDGAATLFAYWPEQDFELHTPLREVRARLEDGSLAGHIAEKVRSKLN